MYLFALTLPKEMPEDNLDFFVTIVRNRGINVNLFYSLEKAISWIADDNEKIV